MSDIACVLNYFGLKIGSKTCRRLTENQRGSDRTYVMGFHPSLKFKSVRGSDIRK